MCKHYERTIKLYVTILRETFGIENERCMSYAVLKYSNDSSTRTRPIDNEGISQYHARQKVASLGGGILCLAFAKLMGISLDSGA